MIVTIYHKTGMLAMHQIEIACIVVSKLFILGHIN